MPPLPSYKEAVKIANGAEIINEGTDHEFVKGCFSHRYQDACMAIGLEESRRRRLREKREYNRPIKDKMVDLQKQLAVCIATFKCADTKINKHLCEHYQKIREEKKNG